MNYIISWMLSGTEVNSYLIIQWLPSHLGDYWGIQGECSEEWNPTNMYYIWGALEQNRNGHHRVIEIAS